MTWHFTPHHWVKSSASPWLDATTPSVYCKASSTVAGCHHQVGSHHPATTSPALFQFAHGLYLKRLLEDDSQPSASHSGMRWKVSKSITWASSMYLAASSSASVSCPNTQDRRKRKGSS